MASNPPGYRSPNHLENQRRWRAKNPNYHREDNLIRSYGITLAQYDAMVEAQEGRCAICSQITERLNVDHDHATNEVRGLLCGTCNRGLGQLGDSVEVLMRAAEYLQAFKTDGEV